MIDTPSDSESSTNTPFQEDILLENYFAGANRKKILNHAQEVLQRNASILILLGEEGSGKTTLCKMHERLASSLCNVVFFPFTVDSFEDVIRLLAAHLGIDVGATVDRSSVEECQGKIISHLLEKAERLLVIFDEAENIYLATLERIRKLIDSLAEAGVKIHVVFSGQPVFLENCEQLSICDFQYTEDFIYRLEPLSQQETGEYLRKCVEPIPLVEPSEIFNERVVKDIYTLTRGNFREISILGEEVLHSPDDDNLFNELLENVDDDYENENERSGIASLLKTIKTGGLVTWAGAIVLCLLVFFSFYNFGSDEVVEKPVVSKQKIQERQPASKSIDPVVKKGAVTELVQENTIPQEKEEISPAETGLESKPPEVAETAMGKPLEEKPEQVEKIEAVKPVEDGNKSKVSQISFTENGEVKEIVDVKEKTVELEKEVKSIDAAKKEIIVAELIEEDTQPEIKPEISVPEPAAKPVEVEKVEATKVYEENERQATELQNELAETVVRLTQPAGTINKVNPTEEVLPPKEIVVELSPLAKTKRKPFLEKLSTEETKQLKEVEQKRHVVVERQAEQKQQTTQVQDIAAEIVNFNVAQLYQKRLSAGFYWRIGQKDHKYTVQIMVLTSKTAEKNLKMMLAEEGYGQEARNFFIFKNNESEALFVFYGEYATIEQARRAKNGLPLFLKEHKPYALSIKGAMAKVSR